MFINSEDKIIWIDILSFTSLYTIYCKRKNIDKIIYLNSSIPFNFLINFLSKKIFCVPLISFDFFNETTARINGISLFEYIQISLTEQLNLLAQSNQIVKRKKIIVKAQNFLDKMGPYTVIFGRFVPAVRPIVPFLLGISDLKAVRFYIADLIACIAWGIALAFLVTGVGSLFG